MGNLLLAPVIASAYAFLMKKGDNKKMLLYFLIFASTLFLTFSRGAIYAFVVAMVFLTAFVIVREKKIRKMIVGKMAIVWGAIILAFLFTLNAQGIMTQISPTNDTYLDGVARAVEQLSLGTINIRGTKVKKNTEEISTPVIDADDEASFDGYVPESTDVRVKLTNVALEEWQSSKKNMLVGVGIGGAGQALYNDDLIDSPKEIVQNQYASLLLETGLVGVTMLAILVFGFLKWCRKTQNAGMALTLALAYAVSLCFFSGLPNALHIYLLLPLFCYNWNYEKSA
jgi:O-antigen ligase